MKKIFTLISLVLIILLSSCNNSLTDEQIADNLLNNLNKLDIPTEVTDDFILETKVSYDEYTVDIIWSSNNKAITINNNKAIVTQTDTTQEVILTANITYNEENRNAIFNIDVLPFNTSILPSDVTYTGYYSDMTGSFNNYDDFFTTLNSIVVDTHTNHLTYKEVWDVLSESDAYDENNVECIYTGMLIDKNARDGSGNTDNGRVWNREHVWAKSHGFDDESYTAYSDAHHLRASEKNINSSRNNSYFDEVTNPTNSDEYGNKWTGSVFEPRDEVKGDVARMLFYMVTRYHDNTLTLTLDNTGSYGSSPTLGKLDTLVKWHYEDPVSETEIKRNEVVYTYQGNRNPYIDHPEFVYYLYEDESKELGVTENNVLEKVSQEDEEDTTVSELISDIETLRDKTITLEDKELLDSLKARYDALTYADKTKVTNYDLLASKIEEYEALLGYNNVEYDLTTFPGNGQSYLKNTTATINGITFYASNHGTGNGFILGSNKNNYIKPDNKYNVSNWSKFSVLEFNVNNLVRLTFDITVLHSGFDDLNFLVSSDGINYTLLDTLEIVEGDNVFYSFTTPYSGYLAIVITGSAPRMGMNNFILTYVD